MFKDELCLNYPKPKTKNHIFNSLSCTYVVFFISQYLAKTEYFLSSQAHGLNKASYIDFKLAVKI